MAVRFGRIIFKRPLVLRERPIELILLLEVLRLLDVRARGFFLRAAQVDLVFRVVGIRLHRLGEVRHRRVPVRRPAPPPARGGRRFRPRSRRRAQQEQKALRVYVS